jgi:hypothetical protein
MNASASASDAASPPDTPKGHRPQVFDDPAVDQLHAAYVTLATELAVAFERIDTLERLLMQHANINRAAIEAAALDEAASADRIARQSALAERLLKPFRDFRQHHIESGSR